MKKDNVYDVVVVGGGVVGTALLYLLAEYTNISRLILVEKYSQVGQVSSKSTNNSQTLHFGDIETNYTVEKARRVKEGAELVATYLETKAPKGVFTKYHKMVLAVGGAQVQKLSKRYEEFKKLFPKLEKIGKEEIAKLEPKIVEGRHPHQDLLALFSPDGYTVDFGKLAASFLEEAKKTKKVDTIIGCRAENIHKEGGHYRLKTCHDHIRGKVVIVCTGAHALIMAKQLGYAKDQGVLPVAGSFYFAPHVLNGKVYTLQIKKLPFAAIHGDPDVNNVQETRFGPTAKVLPFLERGKYLTFFEFLRTSAWTPAGILSLIKIISEWTLFRYVVRNFVYDMPIIGKRMFIKEVRKIIPSIKLKELKYAKGVGGIRPQVVDTKAKKLNMGEAKITGDKVIFNITPSPGASTCLANALRDTKTIIKWLDANFDEEKFRKDFSVKDL